MAANKQNDKLIEWFKQEGALTQEGNVYRAQRVFVANSIVAWIREQSTGLQQDEIEYVMKTVRLFLQNQIDLKWNLGRIEIGAIPGGETRPLFGEI